MRLSGNELMQATGGSWRKGMPDSVGGVSTDSRKFIDGHAFLALRGPNFDGHGFAERVAAQACALIGDEQGVKLWDNLATPQLQVEDTLVALGDIANAWRRRLSHTTVIAITGSYGKTTVRSMLAHLFSGLGIRTAATHANLNNLVGVPTTLLDVEEATEVALIECGISEKGEMSRLSEIVEPDIAVLTGISAAHSAGLGGIEGVSREKSILTEYLQPQGWCLLGGGVAARLADLKIKADCIDMESDNDEIVRWQLAGTRLTLFAAGERAGLDLPLPAAHLAANMALAATIVRRHLREQPGRKAPALDRIAAILSQWRAVDGRMQELSGAAGARIINDSYNANPASMQAALDTLARIPGKKVAILGDMAELDEAAEAHAGLSIAGIDMLVLVGQQIRALQGQCADALWFATTDEAVAWAKENRNSFDQESTVLVKASRSMQLDRIVRVLTGREDMYAL